MLDLDTGEVLIDYRPDHDFLIGSVRKIFSVGELFNPARVPRTAPCDLGAYEAP